MNNLLFLCIIFMVIYMRSYPVIKISKKASIKEEMHHPWIFDNEIEEINGEYKNGDLVDVVNYKDKYVGTGYINDNSKIRVRIISRNANDKFDDDFFERRIRYSVKYRYDLLNDLSTCRLIFGEADYFSGLTVDKYNNILVIEINSLWIENKKNLIYNLLIKVLSEYGYEIDGIYERCDNSIRVKEGLDLYFGFYKDYKIPNYDNTIVELDNIKYIVNFENGQKTGFFLDQRFNRIAIRNISKNKNVLDVCTCTGSFGLNAYLGGAKRVVSVDISKNSLDVARENAKLNGFEIEYVESDAFKYLDSIKKGEFDLIILDPPAFTKSHEKLQNAKKGYEELNFKAIKKLERGSYLATCSCSSFMREDMFLETINEAARKCDVELRLIEARRQSLDHPILINVPETYYLKFFVFQIV